MIPTLFGGTVPPSYPMLQTVTGRTFIPTGQAQELLQRSRSNPRGIRHRFDALTLKVAELTSHIGRQMSL